MKKILVAAAFSAALIAGPAFAQVYLGAGGGSAKTDTHQKSWTAYGGYQFTPIWGIEAGFNDMGSYHGSDISNWTLAGTATMPLGDRWSVLGKLGGVSNRPHFTGSANHQDVLVGVGTGYSLTKNVGLRLEYEDFGKLSSGNNSTHGSMWALSAKYSF